MKNIVLNKHVDFLYDTEQLAAIHVVFCNQNAISGVSTDLNRLRVDYPDAFKVAKEFMLDESNYLGKSSLVKVNNIQYALIMAQSSLFEGDYVSPQEYRNSLVDETLQGVGEFLDGLDATNEHYNIVSVTPLQMQGFGEEMNRELLNVGKYYEKIYWRILK